MATDWMLSPEEAAEAEAQHRTLMSFNDSVDEPIRMALQPGATKMMNGKRYLLNQNHRWVRDYREADGPLPGRGKIDESQFNKKRSFAPVSSEGKSVYGVDGSDKLEVEKGGRNTSSSKADSWEEANRRLEKHYALKYVSNRAYTGGMLADHNGDGVHDSARVGIPAHEVQPPPPLKRIAGLSPKQQIAEAEFMVAYEENQEYFDHLGQTIAKVIGDKDGNPPTYGTDDMKILAGEHWEGAENRAGNNVALHQTANAIAKRAFLKHLDTLEPGQKIMVTVGGCGAGKGYTLSQVPEAKEIMDQCAAVWDSAGDQNATENPWILEEAEKRGLKASFLYVHADPKVSWAGPFGVVQRATNPNNGRMVTARVFADSYAHGAKNHMNFHAANKENAEFIFVRNGGKQMELLDGIPESALVDADELYDFAVDTIENKTDIPSHVRDAALFKFMKG